MTTIDIAFALIVAAVLVMGGVLIKLAGRQKQRRHRLEAMGLIDQIEDAQKQHKPSKAMQRRLVELRRQELERAS